MKTLLIFVLCAVPLSVYGRGSIDEGRPNWVYCCLMPMGFPTPLLWSNSRAVLPMQEIEVRDREGNLIEFFELEPVSDQDKGR